MECQNIFVFLEILDDLIKPIKPLHHQDINHYDYNPLGWEGELSCAEG